MTNKKILEKKLEEAKTPENDFYYHGEYHEINYSDLAEVLDRVKDEEEFESFDDFIEKMDYDGRIGEIADSNTPIYYYDIAKWFGENYSAVDEYVSEMGAPEAKDFDIMKLIQGAFYISYERDLKSAFETFFEDIEKEEVK